MSKVKNLDDKLKGKTPTKKILIATPCYDKLEPGYFMSMVEMIPFTTNTYDVRVYVQHKLSLEHARNKIVKEIFLPSDCTHIAFIDDDMMFGKDFLVTLAKEEKDLITALNFKTSAPFKPAIYKQVEKGWVHFREYQDNACLEVDAFGLAFSLISRTVFEKIPYPWFFQSYEGKEGFVEGDLNFCKKAKENKFRLYCHTGVKTGHVGKNLVTEEFHKEMYAREKISKIITPPKNIIIS